MKRKKAVFNWSGGKDSALALYKVLQSNEYEIVSLLTTVNRDSGRSSMHAIPTSLLNAQAESIGIPLYIVDLIPKGDMTNYENSMKKAVNHFKAQEVTHFIFGDIFLYDVRSYRESQLAPFHIEVVEPLWDGSSSQIIEEFLQSGLQTIIVTTMANLLGKEYIGKLINRSLIESLPKEIDVCGENGEYHTFCFDGPIFKQPVVYKLGIPFEFSNTIKMDDGTHQTFTYWFANLEEK